MEFVPIGEADVATVGLGTARSNGREAREMLETGIDIGYRRIDTAQMYENEDVVGDVVAASSVPRDDFFVTTKVLRENLAPADLRRTVEESLATLRLDCVDLLLIHHPNPEVPVEASLEAMNTLQAEGRVEHIGVSNFDVPRLSEAITASKTPIVANQVEYNPFHQQPELHEFCIENGIMLTAHRPLAVGDVVTNTTLQEIGTRHGKTAAQVALRWLIQQPNVSAVPKSTDPTHLRENLDLFDFELSPGEMDRITALDEGA